MWRNIWHWDGHSRLRFKNAWYLAVFISMSRMLGSCPSSRGRRHAGRHADHAERHPRVRPPITNVSTTLTENILTDGSMNVPVRWWHWELITFCGNPRFKHVLQARLRIANSPGSFYCKDELRSSSLNTADIHRCIDQISWIEVWLCSQYSWMRSKII